MLILLIFLIVATLGSGTDLLVNNLITFAVSLPETLIMATPETPGPVDKAYMVIAINISDIIHINIILIMNSKEEIFNKTKKLYLELIKIDGNNFLFQNLLGTTLLQIKNLPQIKDSYLFNDKRFTEDLEKTY